MRETKGIIAEIQEIANYANRTCLWKRTRLFDYQNIYRTACGVTMKIEMEKDEILAKGGLVIYCEKCGGKIEEVKE